MKKTLKIVGLLILGAILGQVFLWAGAFALMWYMGSSMDKSLLTSITFLNKRHTDPSMMSDEEFLHWNRMCENIYEGKYLKVNEIIKINNGDVEFSVIPAKSKFEKGESSLAEMRITNISPRVLHINEPQLMRMTKTCEHNGYQKNQFIVSLSPLESNWMKTLKPGDKISLPIIIPTDTFGKQRAMYWLNTLRFNDSHSKQLFKKILNIAKTEAVFSFEDTVPQ